MAVDLTHLPDDPELLKRVIEDLTSQLDRLHKQIDFLSRQLFGRKSEKIDPKQLWFDNEEIRKLLDTEAPLPREEEPAPQAPKESPRKGHGRRPLPAHLARVRRELPDPEGACTCPGCGGARFVIGEEVTERLEYRPASVYIEEWVRKKWGCRKCEGQIVIADLPPQPIDKGMAGTGLLAHVITSKYADHLPLHRQVGILARHGLEISVETLCGWIGLSAALLEPLHLAMKGIVLRSKVVQTDDTPVPVQDSSRDRTRKGRLWVYVGDKEHESIVYDFTPDHGGDGPEAFLGDYQGYLQADAFPGYDAIYAKGKIIEVGCWAHARRKFFDARSTDSRRSSVALAFIHELYDIEKAAKDLDAAARAKLRIEKSRPILERLLAWLEGEVGHVLPQSPMGDAIDYVRNHWAAFTRYVEDGDLLIDNNASERALRAIAVGRKNWLFAGSDEGGRRAAILYSLIASCKRHGIDPFVYLRDVLARVSTHPGNKTEELLPGKWSPVSAQPPPS